MKNKGCKFYLQYDLVNLKMKQYNIVYSHIHIYTVNKSIKTCNFRWVINLKEGSKKGWESQPSIFYILQRETILGFPGCSVVKNPPANAADTGSIPESGRSYILSSSRAKSRNYWAHVLQLLKPACPRARALQQEKAPQWEAWAPHLASSPHSLQLEKSPWNSEDLAQR